MAAASAAVPSAAGVFRLTAAARGKFAAAGPLTFATARLACEEGLRALTGPAGGAVELDCGGITASDSAGLAVLLEWLSAARRAGHTVRYTHLPEGLLTLGRISELEELLARGV